MNKNQKIAVGLGAGVAALIFAATRQGATGGNIPQVGAVWGTGPGSPNFKIPSHHILTVTVKNPTSTPWTYDVTYLLDGKVAANIINGITWPSITIAPGQTVTLKWDVAFGWYQPGDANLDGKINMADVNKIERILLDVDPPTDSADVNSDGQIDMGEVTRIERIIMGVDPPPPINYGVVSHPGNYSSQIKVVEKSTNTEWTFDFDDVILTWADVLLYISSVPSGASVYIDGLGGLIGVTPLSISVPYSIVDPNLGLFVGVKLVGYEDWMTELFINAGETVYVNAVLTPVPVPDVQVGMSW